MLAITNAIIVMPDHYIPDATILVDGEEIVDFGKKVDIPEGAEILNAEGLYVGPGLIDIHVHADGKYLFYKDPAEASKTLLSHGITSVMPALYPTNNYVEGMNRIYKSVEQGEFKNFLGFYMEGPYINAKYGSNKSKNQWGGPIDIKDYGPIVDTAGEYAKVWCVAPERDGILEFVKYAKSVNPNTIFSVAHSEATPAQIEVLIPYGLKNATHHTNATGTLESFPECRSVCVDEMVNYRDDIYAEIISDFMGIHVDPFMQRLILKIKGRDKVILVSDGGVAAGKPIKGCEEAFDLSFDVFGDISGFMKTLDVTCANFIKHTGSSICDAFKFASKNPATLLGITNIGEIKRGNISNLILVDHRFNVKKVIFKGEVQ